MYGVPRREEKRRARLAWDRFVAADVAWDAADDEEQRTGKEVPYRVMKRWKRRLDLLHKAKIRARG
jgi:hypothetical protein